MARLRRWWPNGSLQSAQRRERVVFATWMAALAAIVGLIVWAAIRQRDRWEDFRVANDCRKVAFVKGGVTVSPTIGAGVGISSSGKIMTGAAVGTALSFDEDKTAWTCKDGVTYWR